MDRKEELLTIVVPVFNEVRTLRTSLERLLKIDLPIPHEILVVDDGSTDGSLSEARSYDDGERVRVLSHERNLGKSAAVRTGIDNARGDILTICDADLEYEPNDYADLLKPLLEGTAEVVYGTRSFGAHSSFSFWYVVGNRLVSFLAGLIFNTWLSDIETCFKMARTETWRRMHLTATGFGIEAEATGKFIRAGHRIYEVPIEYTARTREEGKKLTWRDGVQAIWILLVVRFLGRPTLLPKRDVAMGSAGR